MKKKTLEKSEMSLTPMDPDGYGRVALSFPGDGGERNPDAFHRLQRHSFADGRGGRRGRPDATPAEFQSQHSGPAPVGASVQSHERSARTAAVVDDASILDCCSPRSLSARKARASMRETTTKTFRTSDRSATSDDRDPASGSISCENSLT